IHGVEDDVAPLAPLEEVLATLPSLSDFKIERIAGAGHFFDNHAGELMRAVNNFDRGATAVRERGFVMWFKQFQLGRIFGIPLIIDYSWPPVAALHILVVSRFWLVAEVQPPLPLWHNLIIGSAITALFFASVLIHELSHAFVAKMEGIRIQDIQLHIFGGW